MNREPLILAVDLGTTTCKTLVVDPQLKVIAKDSVEYPVDIPRAGWAEQDPRDWWALAKTSIARVTAQVDPQRILTVGLSGQMHGLVLMDQNGSPLRPAILWNDQRAAAQCAEVYEKTGGWQGLLTYTNNPMLPGYTGGKLLWVRQNEPDLFAQASHFCMPKDYLRFRLTGEAATDVSDASGTGLYDVRRRRWAEGLLDLLDLPRGWFPHVYESGETAGTVTEEAEYETGLRRGTPVAAGGGDAVIQTVGGGGIDSQVVLLVIGTAGNVTVSLPGAIDNPEARLQVFCHVLPEQWAALGVTLSAGSSLRWFRDRLGALESALAKDFNLSAYTLLGEQAWQSPPGANGLIFLPYLQGERAPHADPNARGAFIGLNSNHNKADLVRAVMEGVAYSLRDVLDLILKAGAKPSRVHASGGGSASPVWRQIIADVFAREVTTLAYSEDAGALGAAIVAGVSAGVWRSAEEAVKLIEVKTVDQPIPGNVEIYAKYFPIYQGLYPALKESFEQMAAQA